METEKLGMRMFGIGRAIQAFDGPDSDGTELVMSVKTFKFHGHG